MILICYNHWEKISNYKKSLEVLSLYIQNIQNILKLASELVKVEGIITMSMASKSGVFSVKQSPNRQNILILLVHFLLPRTLMPFSYSCSSVGSDYTGLSVALVDHDLVIGFTTVPSLDHS